MHLVKLMTAEAQAQSRVFKIGLILVEKFRKIVKKVFILEQCIDYSFNQDLLFTNTHLRSIISMCCGLLIVNFAPSNQYCKQIRKNNFTN